LQLAFSLHFDGLLWRIFPDIEQPLLVVEARHSDRKVSFAAVDLANKKLLWNHFVLPESWWSSGVLLQNGILFVQTFPEGQNPEPRGISAIEVEVEVATQQLRWHQPDLQFLQLVTSSRLLARKPTGAGFQYYMLDVTTGIILEESPTPFAELPVPPLVPGRLRFPTHYTPDDQYFESIATFVFQTLRISPQFAFDYAEINHCIIISYYIYAEKQIENFLAVFDTHSRVPLLHEKIATQRTGIGRDTFFIFDQLLIFVKEQTVLLSYEI